MQIQNMITRVNYDVRNLLVREYSNAADNEITMELKSRIAEMAEPLVAAMFMADEAVITDTMEGSSGFREKFEARGPVDSRGRSLRQLDLSSRLFRYPLSYLVYSPAFNALPEVVKEIIFERFRTILTAANTSEAYTHLENHDRLAILEILEETHPDF
ncbi:MAG: hypothetical protein HKN08_04085 [Gammaproteobacteria bacterium]|nr:hypothetical protein [Gammaproteobacteria bacterium]